MIQDDPLPPDQRAAYAAVPRELEPSPALEQRVVDELYRRRVLRSRPAGRRWLAVAAVLVFATGVAAGRWWPAASAPHEGQRYLLFLYGAEATSPEDEAARVAEYGAWAGAEAAAGRLEAGEKLDGPAIVVGAARDQSEQPSGFFVIRAESDEQAQAIASGCPHVRHGGTVVVKRIAQ